MGFKKLYYLMCTSSIALQCTPVRYCSSTQCTQVCVLWSSNFLSDLCLYIHVSKDSRVLFVYLYIQTVCTPIDELIHVFPFRNHSKCKYGWLDKLAD